MLFVNKVTLGRVFLSRCFSAGIELLIVVQVLMNLAYSYPNFIGYSNLTSLCAAVIKQNNVLGF